MGPKEKDIIKPQLEARLIRVIELGNAGAHGNFCDLEVILGIERVG